MAFGPVMISLAATQLSTQEVKLLNHELIGGVILFQENFSSKDQLIQLIANIRSLNPQALIAIDHEGGRVQRFISKDFTRLPDAKSYGELYDRAPQEALDKAYRYAQSMAQELLDCGVNLSFAPVLDVHREHSQIIGKYRRAFHQERAVLTKIATQFAKGMQAAGMPVTGKHFPEHGVCVADSHVEMPIDEREVPDIMDGLSTYRHLIQHGLLDVVMPAHVCYPKLDPDNPAGFSRTMLHSLLREQLNFKGLIISDCLGMGALNIPPEQRVNQALSAGQDMVIFSHQSPEMMMQLLPLIHTNDKASKKRLERVLTQSNYTHREKPPQDMIQSSPQSKNVSLNQTVLNDD